MRYRPLCPYSLKKTSTANRVPRSCKLQLVIHFLNYEIRPSKLSLTFPNFFQFLHKQHQRPDNSHLRLKRFLQNHWQLQWLILAWDQHSANQRRRKFDTERKFFLPSENRDFFIDFVVFSLKIADFWKSTSVSVLNDLRETPMSRESARFPAGNSQEKFLRFS